ncbi:hypothetical protein HM1_1637 [Heliomicrobium modesticaldum Ice1]|uniref:Uncharacterized protein n=1 Tax=Heliobacterium modesticaldum (strain ATCC 51547 / Ice1) TaxID=498761 RepID=B0TE12_HELMI|nr:hypothetical protein HM1_1637 [Heliomicrobium modesticaldum Ice1]
MSAILAPMPTGLPTFYPGMQIKPLSFSGDDGFNGLFYVLPKDHFFRYNDFVTTITKRGRCF